MNSKGRVKKESANPFIITTEENCIETIQCSFDNLFGNQMNIFNNTTNIGCEEKKTGEVIKRNVKRTKEELYSKLRTKVDFYKENLPKYEEDKAQKELPFFYKDTLIRKALRISPYLYADHNEIKEFYKQSDKEEKDNYTKDFFNEGETVINLSEEESVIYKKYDNGLELWECISSERVAHCFYTWKMITCYYEAMILLDELDNSYDGKTFKFTEKFLDAVMLKGSGFVRGKLRIYDFFKKTHSSKERADFLKDEYGIGGCSPAVSCTSTNMNYDSNGIKIRRGYSDQAPSIHLKWNDVEKRIALLVKRGVYLNKKETEEYAEWLEENKKVTERNEDPEIINAKEELKIEKEESKNLIAASLGDKIIILPKMWLALANIVNVKKTFRLFDSDYEVYVGKEKKDEERIRFFMNEYKDRVYPADTLSI